MRNTKIGVACGVVVATAFMALGAGAAALADSPATSGGDLNFMGWACRGDVNPSPQIEAVVWRRGTEPGTDNGIFSIRVTSGDANSDQGQLINEIDNARQTEQGDSVIYQGASIRGGLELSISESQPQPNPVPYPDLDQDLIQERGLPSVLRISRALRDGDRMPLESVVETWCIPTR